MTLPNLITLLRILLVPVILWAILGHSFGLAFTALLLAGFSDGVDGYLARHLNLKTELGAYLDAIADKLLLVAVFLSLGFLGYFPSWLVILCAGRDLLIIGAVLLSWGMKRNLEVRAHPLGKANTAAQILLAVAALGLLALGRPFGFFMDMGFWSVGALTFASGTVYLMAWMTQMTKADDPRSG